MSLLGATFLSLLGAIITFFSVLAALDGVATAPWPTTPTSRVGAFAAPGLAAASATGLAVLRPIPVTNSATESRAAPAEPRAHGNRQTPPRQTAIVAPLVRRAPASVVLASDEPQEAPVLKTAKPTAPPPQPRLAARKPFAPETRSALGGPLPATPRTPSPPAPRKRSTPAPAPSGPSSTP